MRWMGSRGEFLTFLVGGEAVEAGGRDLADLG